MSVELNADLAPHHTLGLRAEVARMVRLRDRASLQAALAEGVGACHILGGGSNLVPAPHVAGTVFKVELGGKRLLREDTDAWYVEAAAGENWHDFVQWTLDMGWPGLENLSLIPGTVGAAPIQNIGAYGVELKDRFHALHALDLQSGEVHAFDGAACRFAYRDSVFKHAPAGRWLILDVTFRLPRHWQAVLDYGDLRARLAGDAVTPRRVADAIMAIRRSKLPDPAVLGNAGSFFHNPIVDTVAANTLKARFPGLPVFPVEGDKAKLAAGWLIEQAGWKGRCLGPVGMYEKQALVLVNHGGATADDVRALMQAVQADVAAQFGVTLRPEPVWW